MKDYNEVAKSVFEHSKEIIIKKNKRNMRIMTAVRISGICLVLAGAVGFGTWWGSNQGNNTVFSTVDGSLPSASDKNNYGETGAAEVSSNEPGYSLTENELPYKIEPTVMVSHTHQYIRSESTVTYTFDAPPENGRVYISSELQNALETFGNSYNDGCTAQYVIRIDYYKNGEPVTVNTELFDIERERLRLFFDSYKNEYHIGNNIGMGGYSSDFGVTTKYFINAELFKEQIENFPPSKDYAIALNLDDSAIVTVTVPTLEKVPQTPQESIKGAIYGYRSGYYALDTPPENGKVIISEGLSEAMEYFRPYSEYYGRFCVVIEYYKDGRRIDPDDGFFHKEVNRLLKECGVTGMGFGSLSSVFNNSVSLEKGDYNIIYAEFDEYQINKILAGEDFGCVIYLKGDYDHSFNS